MLPIKHFVKGNRCVLLSIRNLSSVSKPLVDLKVDNEGIGVLSMQRSPVNSLNTELLNNIADALDEVEKNKLRGVVITSSLPSIFSAGMDIKEMYRADASKIAGLWKAMRRVTSHLLCSGYVSTAAVNGHTSAGGCILAVLTEYRVMVDSAATISLNDTELDITPPSWVVEAMQQVMGRRKAELALTASTKFSPQEALKESLIDDIAINNEAAIEKCKNFIKLSKNINLLVLEKTKENIRRSIIDVWNVENHPDTMQEHIKVVTSPERQKALELYLEVMKNKKANKNNS